MVAAVEVARSAPEGDAECRGYPTTFKQVVDFLSSRCWVGTWMASEAERPGQVQILAHASPASWATRLHPFLCR
jgi:hypothetical protein